MSRRTHVQVWKRWVLWLVPGLLVFSTTVAGPLAMARWADEVVLFRFVMIVTVLCATGVAIVVVIALLIEPDAIAAPSVRSQSR